MSKGLDNNRFKRMQLLDNLLSKNEDGCTMKELVDGVNAQLSEPTNRHAIARDINFLKNELGISITEVSSTVLDGKYRRELPVKRFRYETPGFSVFSVSLTDEERKFLSDALDMLGLKGIENTRMFRELKLKAKSKNQIISFTKNPSEKSISNVLSDLVGYIKREQVVSLNVRNRKPPYAKVRHRVHPWYLREYNRRWYLFGFDVGESKIMHYALDRIDHRIGELKSVEYKKPQVSVEDILQDCIGVSIHNDTEPMEIIFWVSDESADFVSNKPLHSSQEEIKIEDHPEVDVRTSLDGGKYFKIFCRDSYELQRELTSFGPELIVLSPEPLRANIKDKLERMIKNYT